MEFKIGYFTPAITVGFCQHFEFLPAATKLGQGNIFTGVCQEFCPQGGRVSASVHAGIHPPPRSRQPPPGSRLQHTVYERPVRILLECILVFLIFPLNKKKLTLLYNIAIKCFLKKIPPAKNTGVLFDRVII